MEEQLETLIHNNELVTTSEDTTSRFKGAEWYEEVKNKNVLIAGIGGIGSWLSLFIARLKPKQLFIMDEDVVDICNLSGQLYNINAVNFSKVDSMNAILKDFGYYYNTMCIPEKFTEESEAFDIMMCGFDNMEARKIYFKKWLELVKSKPQNERKNCLFIDGRLNAEKFQIFSITGEDYHSMKEYSTKYLFSDLEADRTMCSYKQTTYCAAMIASFMCNTFVNFLCHSDERPVLFFQEYDATNMFLKQIS